MSLSTLSRSLALVVLVAAGCAGGGPPRSDEPTTAREKQRRDTEAKGDPAPGGKWGGWRYTGERNDCFFVVGRRCFKTEASACAAARCGQHKCDITGGGPASVGCAK